ncbi:type I DNA topoisomerase [Anaerofustis sp.]|uniref:type I DNA topoisomerase n=1 Tax=Anaerofustis sp. TaxID=1872517 RepID=UPI0025C61734|nr:type I DNA topoisomerase [Anaerofustis sp.]
MSYRLVIVESPAKAKTIQKYLPKDCKVVASKGHVIDLPKSKLGIDIENNFEPEYKTIRGQGERLKKLKADAKKADEVILATDNDREGEAISWHIANYLGLDLSDKNRMEFLEITPSAINNAINHKRKIDMNIVDAQQARRVLDRLVGYKISPVLWSKVLRGLSAGRVQSVAMRLIIDRENEIRNFVSEEYWLMDALLSKTETKEEFLSKLALIKGKKAEIKNKEQADNIIKELKKNKFIVKEVKRGTKKKNSPPPFETSSMQQDASSKLNFSISKTMMLAQQLYEGVEVEGVGQIGLITYLRTDSTRLSKEAIQAGSDFIINNYGKEYIGYTGVKSKSGSKIQDAHEAIRPSDVNLTPDKLKTSLTSDQLKLYTLIYNRFLASLMAPAVYDTLRVDIENGEYIFRSTGSRVKFKGYLEVYDFSSKKGEENESIPMLEEGEEVNLKDLKPMQKFTQPPARYNEASLVKVLKEEGIGRPSTYSQIINTIKNRGYVDMDQRRFIPTMIGEAVDKLLRENFEDIVDVDFTAQMESSLDNIEEGKRKWKDVISDFYKELAKELDKAKDIERIKLPEEQTDEICENCGKPMVIKYGRFGKFMACSGYPECKTTKAIVKEIDAECPKCSGQIVERKSKKGSVFYGCKNYPKCDFASSQKPTKKICPQCGEILYESKGKKKTLFCKNKECKYKEEL